MFSGFENIANGAQVNMANLPWDDGKSDLLHDCYLVCSLADWDL